MVWTPRERRPRRSPADRDVCGRKTRRDGLTIAKRERFLAVLNATSNVEAAARAADATRSAFDRLRQRDPAFDAACTQAVSHGEEELKLKMLAHARGTADPDDRTDRTLGLAMLKQADARAAGRQAPIRIWTAQVPMRVVYEEILRRLAVIARRRERMRTTGEGR